MSDFHRDPELNRLIHEINEAEEHPVRARAEVGNEEALGLLLAEMIGRHASDLLLVQDIEPSFRVEGEIVRSERPALGSEAVRRLLAPHLDSRIVESIERRGNADFSLRAHTPAGPSRFRVNLHRQRGSLAAAIRAIPPVVPRFETLGLPSIIREFSSLRRGLILVCGPTGSGKSTTIASLVREIAATRRSHIVTIEDPIEYEHASDASIVEQIEIGRDASDFHAALRSTLRQDPDVILLGEMRDSETAAAALTAAETGHLVLSTLHTSDAAQSLNRIVDLFDSDQLQIHRQLAMSLHSIVVQQLLPRADSKGRAVACEILLMNDAMRNHIRQQRLQNIHSELTLGRRAGMRTMEDSLMELVRSGAVSLEEARLRARYPEELDR